MNTLKTTTLTAAFSLALAIMATSQASAGIIMPAKSGSDRMHSPPSDRTIVDPNFRTTIDPNIRTLIDPNEHKKGKAGWNVKRNVKA